MDDIFDAATANLVAGLEARSAEEAPALGAWFGERASKGELSWDGFDARSTQYMADKMVALEPEKSRFCYLTCRALRARKVVEIGTSFGVSTLYLAAAVKANGGGVVTGTEHEAAKAASARATWARTALADQIELLEGDLRETLRNLTGPVDFVLMDIWTEMARPAIELVAPHMRPGAVVMADNIISSGRGYGPYLDFIHNPANGFSTQTLPFSGGVEFSVKI